jgi:RNA polymerase sigma factor (TIGR02999 family)
MTSSRNITELLVAWSDGDRAALDELMPLVYDELRGLASAYLARERPGHTLQTTALVHEAYLKLVDQRRVQWQNRAHFFGIAAQMMRRILVSHARAHRAEKRGRGAQPLSLDEVPELSAKPKVDLVALDDALDRLTEIDPRQGRVVELRFFGGLSIDEAGEVLSLSPATVGREWTMAKAWLYKELGGSVA